MDTPATRFNDGAAYERFMGQWSQLAGQAFLDWLAQGSDLAWLDVGCGTGAFTELVLSRCRPRSIAGIDPSPGQLAYARNRFAAGRVEFHEGDAMAMPFADAAFDVAVMPLVIFFVPDPAKGVAEMARVVTGGGTVAAYAWDMAGGGFPYAPLLSELNALGLSPPGPPSPDASRLDQLESLWRAAGLDSIEATTITVERGFDDFDDYWTTIQGSPSAGTAIKSAAPETRRQLQDSLRARLSPDIDGGITCSARANAVRGRTRR